MRVGRAGAGRRKEPQITGGRASLAVLPPTTTGGGRGGARAATGVRGGLSVVWGGTSRGYPGGRPGPARASDARRAPRPRVRGSGDEVVARCRRPRHSVGSQPGQIGWRLGNRAALGQQHTRTERSHPAGRARVPRLPLPGARRSRPSPAPSP